MAITRTAKGTAANKTSQATLTLSSVQLDAGSLLIVGLGYETDQGNPTSVKWGTRELKIVADTTATGGDTRCRLYRAVIKNTSTRDIVATWGGNVTAKAMFATMITETSALDQSVSLGLAATTAPDTGSAGSSTAANTISIAAFVTGGPSGDTQGSAGSGHTLGQRVGTTGGGAGSNVTIQETYEILSSTGTVQASLSGITSRIVACTVAAFKAQQTYTVDDVYQPLNTLPQGEDVIVVISTDTPGELIHLRFPITAFDTLTDAEVDAIIADYCAQHLQHVVEGDFTPTDDPARNARMAAFVNDTVVL